MSRPATRRAGLHADRPATAYVIAAAVALVMAVSMFISFYGLAAVGQWMGLPSAASWTLPVMLDGGIIAYTLSTYLRRAQGRSSVYPWVMVSLATAVSASANCAHVLIAASDGLQPQVVVGAILAGLAPAWAAASAHQVGDLVAPGTAPAPRRATTNARDAPVVPVPGPDSNKVSKVASVADRPAASAARRDLDRDAARRTVIELAREGQSQRQIADAVSMPKSTVARWITQAAQEPAAVSQHTRRHRSLITTSERPFDQRVEATT